MAKIISIDQVESLSPQQRYWVYNAADCTGTLEIAENLRPRLKGQALNVYHFEMASQNPAFAITRRGLKVNLPELNARLKAVKADVKRQQAAVAQRPDILAVWDATEQVTGQCKLSTRADGRHKWEKWTKGTSEIGRKCVECGTDRLTLSAFNCASHQQCKRLFGDLLKMKLLRNKKGALSTEEEVLQRMQKANPQYADMLQAIIDVRHLQKQAGFLSSRISPDGRWLSVANVGATLSGRWSSSKNPMGYGNGIANIADHLRTPFIPDPGYEIAYADLKQAESYVVAALAEDEAYMEAHQSGDVHTYNTRILFPEYEWTGDIEKDKALAKSLCPSFDPEHDLRHHGKRQTHGYSYGVSPQGTATQARIPLEVSKRGHAQLDRAFPGIKGTYHPEVIERVKQQLPLVTPVGRPILLMGRPDDSATYRQGYSLVPQSLVADLVNIALFEIWRDLDPHLVQVLGNGYDAVLMQWKRKDRDEALAEVVKRMEVPVMIKQKQLTIPVEVLVGMNWGHASKTNPEGLQVIYG